MPSFRDQVNKARPAAATPPQNNTRDEVNEAADEIEKLIRQYILTESRKIPRSKKLRITGCVKCQLYREVGDLNSSNVTGFNQKNRNPFVDVRGKGYAGGFFGLVFPPHSVHSFSVTPAGEQLLDILKARLEPDGIRLGQWSIVPNSCSAPRFGLEYTGRYPFICGEAEECFPLPASIQRKHEFKNRAKISSRGFNGYAKAINDGHHLSLPFNYE